MLKGERIMKYRIFKIDNEWNIIHYPERPNGFGILLIGNQEHYVDEKGSFWTENVGRNRIIEILSDAGYTIFYSNLYGRNWGSKRAVELAKRLYEYVKRNEILNENIHLIAEGMGALVAVELVKEMSAKIRSVFFINPCFSLKTKLLEEKEHKFFYKRFIYEVSTAHQINEEECELFIMNRHEYSMNESSVPFKIIHVLENGQKDLKMSKQYKQIVHHRDKEEKPLIIRMLVPERRGEIATQAIVFFKQYEKVL
jgi:hypothetical protein